MNVIVDSSFVDMLIYAVFGIAIGLVVVLVAWGVREWRTPRESKETRAASGRHRALNILATDEGKIKFRMTDKTGPEGVTMTKPEGREKRHWTGFLARKGKTQEDIRVAEQTVYDTKNKNEKDPVATEEKTNEVQVKTEALATYLNGVSSKRCYLEGARIPVSFAVEGKALLIDICGIAGVQLTEALKAACPELPIDVTALKRMVVGNSWNESQINAQEEDMKQIGRLERAKQAGLKDSWIPWLIGVGIFFGGLAAVIAVVKFL